MKEIAVMLYFDIYLKSRFTIKKVNMPIIPIIKKCSCLSVMLKPNNLKRLISKSCMLLVIDEINFNR